MRQIMFLGLLALALPTAALATSINPDDNSGSEAFTIATGTINPSLSSVTPGVGNGAFTVGAVWDLTGSTGRIEITFQTLTGACLMGPGTCDWTGTLSASGGGNSIMDSVFGGTLTRVSSGNGRNTFTGVSELSAKLVAQAPFEPDSHLTMANLSWCNSDNSNGCNTQPAVGVIRQGSGTVDVDEVVIPEPSTLGMLGTGLVGLAGIARRKSKVRT